MGIGRGFYRLSCYISFPLASSRGYALIVGEEEFGEYWDTDVLRRTVLGGFRRLLPILTSWWV